MSDGFKLGLYLGDDPTIEHIRVGGERQDGTHVELLGMAADLHGPRGCCTCCHGRQTPAEAKAAVLARVNDAASDEDKARIDAAILAVARRGQVFSANDFRDAFPESGGIVGARVAVVAKREGFEHVGYIASSKPNTHGHEIKTWRLAVAMPRAG